MENGFALSMVIKGNGVEKKNDMVNGHQREWVEKKNDMSMVIKEWVEKKNDMSMVIKGNGLERKSEESKGDLKILEEQLSALEEKKRKLK